jgi:hypothetical protein
MSLLKNTVIGLLFVTSNNSFAGSTDRIPASNEVTAANQEVKAIDLEQLLNKVQDVRKTSSRFLSEISDPHQIALLQELEQQIRAALENALGELGYPNIQTGSQKTSFFYGKDSNRYLTEANSATHQYFQSLRIKLLSHDSMASIVSDLNEKIKEKGIKLSKPSETSRIVGQSLSSGLESDWLTEKKIVYETGTVNTGDRYTFSAYLPKKSPGFIEAFLSVTTGNVRKVLQYEDVKQLSRRQAEQRWEALKTGDLNIILSDSTEESRVALQELGSQEYFTGANIFIKAIRNALTKIQLPDQPTVKIIKSRIQAVKPEQIAAQLKEVNDQTNEYTIEYFKALKENAGVILEELALLISEDSRMKLESDVTLTEDIKSKFAQLARQKLVFGLEKAEQLALAEFAAAREHIAPTDTYTPDLFYYSRGAVVESRVLFGSQESFNALFLFQGMVPDGVVHHGLLNEEVSGILEEHPEFMKTRENTKPSRGGSCAQALS